MHTFFFLNASKDWVWCLWNGERSICQNLAAPNAWFPLNVKLLEQGDAASKEIYDGRLTSEVEGKSTDLDNRLLAYDQDIIILNLIHYSTL